MRTSRLPSIFIRAIVLAWTALLTACAAVTATAPVSSAAIATYDLINLRQLPLPEPMVGVYFERPATLAERREVQQGCYAGQGIDLERRGEPGLRVPPVTRPPCPNTPVALSSEGWLRALEGDDRKRAVAFLEAIRTGWSADSILQSGAKTNMVLANPYYPQRGREYALHAMGRDRSVTIVIHPGFLEYVDVRDRKRAIRYLTGEEVGRLRELDAYPFRT